MKSNRFLLHPLSAVVFAATSALSVTANAEPILWTGVTSNDWAEPTNWDTGNTPVAEDDVTIDNGDTVLLDGTLDSVQANYIKLGTTGDGFLESQGTTIYAHEITMGTGSDFGGATNSSFVIENADLYIEYLDHTTYDAVGHSEVQFSMSSDTTNTFDATSIDTGAYVRDGDAASLDVDLNFENLVVNTVYGLEIGGDIRTKNDGTGSRMSSVTNIVISDSDFNLTPTNSGGRSSDMEIGGDVKTGWDSINNTVHAETNLLVESSELEFTYLELGEYTGTLGDPTIGATVTNKVAATINDSQILLDKRLILGDVGASGDADTTVEEDVNLTLNNSTLEAETIHLNDTYVRGAATGREYTAIVATNSELALSEYVEIATDIRAEDSGILDAKGTITLEGSSLSVAGPILISDVASKVENNQLVNPENQSVTGEMAAFNSVIDAEQVVVGSSIGNATLQLNQAYLSLSDIIDSEDPSDVNSLEANEGALTLSDSSTLVIDAYGYDRADENAELSNGTYGAIDVMQVKLDGTLVINVEADLDEDSSFDIIRAVRDDSVVLGEGAFTGILGEFDNIVFNNLPNNAKTSTEIVTETIDGVTYDVYRVNAGSLGYLSFALVALMGFFRAFRK